MRGLTNPGKKVVGLAWTGTYRTRSDHKLGWVMPHFVAHNDSSSMTTDQKRVLGIIPNRQFAKGDMWRVKITIEAVKDKRGRFIVKRHKKAKAKLKPSTEPR